MSENEPLMLFNQNGKLGGYDVGDYDFESIHPTSANWTRQSVFSGPNKPNNHEYYLNDVFLDSAFSVNVNNEILIGSEKGSLFLITPYGEINEIFNCNQPIGIPIIGKGGTIYFGTSGDYNSRGHKLYSISKDGSINWVYDLDYMPMNPPVIGSDGSIYITTDGTRLLSISPKGELNWKFEKEFEFWSVPILSMNKILYIGAGNKNLYAVSFTGNELWSLQIGHGESQKNFIVDLDENIYLYAWGNKGKLLCINNAVVKWEYCPDIGDVCTAPALSNSGMLYLGASHFRLISLDRKGKQTWVTKVNGFFLCPPIVAADGTIFTATYNSIGGKKTSWITAVNNDGTLKWELEFKGRIVPPVLTKNNTIYTISLDSNTKKCILHTISD